MLDDAQNLLLVNFQIAAGVLATPVLLYVGSRVEDRDVSERIRKLGYAISMCLIASGLLFRVDLAPTAAGNAIGPILAVVAFAYALRITWRVKVRDNDGIWRQAIPLERNLANVAMWSMAMIAGGAVAAYASF